VKAIYKKKKRRKKHALFFIHGLLLVPFHNLKQVQ